MASPSPRRRFQFSLRTLLVVVTVLAVACWVIVDRQRLIRERDNALLRELTAMKTAAAMDRNVADLNAQLNRLMQARADSKPGN